MADFIKVPEVYPLGRLDLDSEGLLLLSNDKRLQTNLQKPGHHSKTYHVQVEGGPDPAALQRLGKGVVIRGKKTLPARARLLEEPDYWPRPVPIRERKSIPTHWLEIELREGRNRQVRRMTAAVGLPTLRLVRVSIGKLSLGGLQPGQHRGPTKKERDWLEGVRGKGQKKRNRGRQ